MSKIKKQHFVPRFYLENFTDVKGKIFVFDIQNSEAFGTIVDNIAHKKYFYDYQPLDEVTGEQTIEKALSQFEGEAAQVLRRTVDHLTKSTNVGPDRGDRTALAKYIVIQQKRTIESRVVSQQFVSEIERQLKSKGVSDEFIVGSGLTASNYDSHAFQIQMLLSPELENSVNDLCDRYWIFWKNQTKHNFYTSDHPVVGYMHSDLNSSGYEIYFPLNPRLAVTILIKHQFVQWADMDNRIMILDNTENVKFYNNLILRKCNRQIFSSENDFRLAKRILKDEPELANPDRPRVARM